MNIAAYAFTKNFEEMRNKHLARYEEIKHLKTSLKIKKMPRYAHTQFTGVLETDEAKQLSEFDLALIADSGNLCFGGECVKLGNSFRGSYNTD